MKKITINWNYIDGYLDISMPYYVNKNTSRLQHTPKVSPQYSPHAHIPIQYATKNTRQYATAPDTSPHLPPQEIMYIQSVTGSHLYYKNAIDHTNLPALNELSSKQAQPTKKTKAKSQCFMEYVHTFSKCIHKILREWYDPTYWQQYRLLCGSQSMQQISRLFPSIVSSNHHQTSKTQRCNFCRIQNVATCIVLSHWNLSCRYLPQRKTRHPNQNSLTQTTPFANPYNHKNAIL